jgi:creatinine amidohydrolase
MPRVPSVLATSLFVLAAGAPSMPAQDLPFRWEELTATDWPTAQQKAAYTCVLPIGILEKHGPHAPMGSDLIQAREWSARAAKREYAVVFPDYFYGQINEAKHQPGAFALPSRVVWDLLDATCDEIGRNGFKKILIVNGHGGNPNLLRYFAQAQLERRRDYVVYFYDPDGSEQDPAFAEKVKKLRHTDAAVDMHAGEEETSTLLYLRPDLVKQDQARLESGADQKRWAIPEVYTGIWWYSRFPNHYAGEGDKATRELGEVLTEHQIESLVRALHAVKADTKALEMQREFYDRVLGK